jgi:hypothetical protein
MDSDGSGELDFGEFRKAIDDYRVGCNGPETDQLFSIFDKNRNGTIDYSEFMQGILGDLNQYRLNIIKQAFASLDKNGNGTLDFDEVKLNFNPSRHPDVQNGSRTLEDCSFEFSEMFTSHHNVSTNFSQSKEVTLDEFIEYHHYISSFIEGDR